ncbi:MAG: polyprenyl synthetase family protein [Kibdelosporangium sp.]
MGTQTSTSGLGVGALAHVESFASWLKRARGEVALELRGFVAEQCRVYVDDVRDAEVLGPALTGYVERGKLFRSAFMLAGWLAVAEQTSAAVRAAASFELLHCFALLQDDVMDGSALRRGSAAAHITFAEWHRDLGLGGSADRFGESAAILASDLCLVWSEQMLRESGVSRSALGKALTRYDRLRSELAVGQFRDLVNQSRRRPLLTDVREVARAKSGDYTVRGPVQLGVELAGGSTALVASLGRYGSAVGEAFQFRDDLLGLYGSSELTGKPVGEDLRARKATCVMVLAREDATLAQRHELARLEHTDELSTADVACYLAIVEETGARARAEHLISERLADGLAELSSAAMPTDARDRLAELARLCAYRVH